MSGITFSRHFIVKSGRTRMMDATPVRLGQEFEGYERQVSNAAERASRARDALLELALGGTAVGTCINHKARFTQTAPGRQWALKRVSGRAR